jgi:hypothetical protein
MEPSEARSQGAAPGSQPRRTSFVLPRRGSSQDLRTYLPLAGTMCVCVWCVMGGSHQKPRASITGTVYHRLGLEVRGDGTSYCPACAAHFKSTQAGSAHVRSSKHHLAAQAAQAGHTYEGGSFCLAAFDKFWCCPCAVCLPRDAFELHVKSDRHRQLARGWKENSSDRLGVRSCAIAHRRSPALVAHLPTTCNRDQAAQANAHGQRSNNRSRRPPPRHPAQKTCIHTCHCAQRRCSFRLNPLPWRWRHHESWARRPRSSAVGLTTPLLSWAPRSAVASPWRGGSSPSFRTSGQSEMLRCYCA